MKCGECAEARSQWKGHVWCVQFGMIIRKDYERECFRQATGRKAERRAENDRVDHWGFCTGGDDRGPGDAGDYRPDGYMD